MKLLRFFLSLSFLYHLDSNATICIEITEKSPMINNRILGDANWGTHMAAFLTAVSHTEGPILELGCGDFSTPLLHAVCSGTKRLLVSAESDNNWLRNFLDLQSDWHKFIYVPSLPGWNEVGENTQWGVVFIDHSPPARRVKDLIRLQNQAQIIVVHDTEKEVFYGVKDALNSFKYRYNYIRYAKQTTLVSNTIDVTQLFQ